MPLADAAFEAHQQKEKKEAAAAAEKKRAADANQQKAVQKKGRKEAAVDPVCAGGAGGDLYKTVVNVKELPSGALRLRLSSPPACPGQPARACVLAPARRPPILMRLLARPSPPSLPPPTAADIWVQYTTADGGVAELELGNKPKLNGKTGASWQVQIYSKSLRQALFGGGPHQNLGFRLDAKGRIWWLSGAVEHLGGAEKAAATTLLFK